MSTHTPVKHSVTGDEWDCPTTFLDHARENGWVPVDEPADSPYAEMTKAQLEAEIGSRNSGLGVDEQLSASGTKADLMATLLADDARRGIA